MQEQPGTVKKQQAIVLERLVLPSGDARTNSTQTFTDEIAPSGQEFGCAHPRTRCTLPEPRQLKETTKRLKPFRYAIFME